MSRGIEFVKDDDGRFVNLANTISDAMHAAMKSGMPADEAISCVISVATDYGRASFGNSYVGGLVNIVLARAAMPLPKDISGGELQ